MTRTSSYVRSGSIAGYFDSLSFGTLHLSMTPAEINPPLDAYPGIKTEHPVSSQATKLRIRRA